MPASLDTPHLTHLAGPAPTGAETLCITLVHNEVNILPQFFEHYRAFGPIRFFMIDDNSTDGSRAYLEAQPDVSLFAPKPGSTYREHKQQWRSEPLDRFAVGRWCLAPDADEHLVWTNAETRPFSVLLSDLEREGAEGLMSIMVDMYCDRPLAEHVSGTGLLTEDFPLFDDPTIDPLAYRLRLPGQSFGRKFPTPAMITTGGMRDRVLMNGRAGQTALYRTLLRNSIRKSHAPCGWARARERLIYLLTSRAIALAPLNMTKLPLLKWQKGGKFNGGAHHLNLPLKLSHERAVLLHFPLTRGAIGARYTAQRGQHYSRSAYYRRVEEHERETPVYFGTTRFSGTLSLQGFFR